MQRSIGNRATGRLLARQLSVQTKLQLGPANDKYEQEADDVARQVVRRMSAPPVQRQDELNEEVQTRPLVYSGVSFESPSVQPTRSTFVASPKVQRQEMDDELAQAKPLADSISSVQRALQSGPDRPSFAPPDVQRDGTDDQIAQAAPNHGLEGGEIEASVVQRIQGARGGGSGLDPKTRSGMEGAFGADFGRVRVHTDGQADSLNRSLNARAFTTGNDIFFRRGEYNPGSSGGKELLAHELTHTVQQGAVMPGKVQAFHAPQSARTSDSADAGEIDNRVQRSDTQYNLARILDVGVRVSNKKGDSNQIGHAMDVWVKIDAGKNPIMPPNARPNTVYGIELEYWEYVNVPHDNEYAVGEKPWNDIYAMKPDATTFTKAADGCDITWGAAVQAAAAGTLRGKHVIGFRDIPGLIPKPGRNVERTLKFRIVYSDGNQRREIYATQLVKMNNGQVGYSAYTDSAGNKIEAHGYGSDNYQAGSLIEQQALNQEGGKLTDESIPTKSELMGKLPEEAQARVQAFVDQIFSGKAAPFVDTELAEWVSQVDADKQENAMKGGWPNLAKAMMGDLQESVAAGHFMIPQIAGTRRCQYVLPSGALLVAIVTQNKILRMYYTDNSTKSVDMGKIQGGGQGRTVHARSFAEIPVDVVQESVSIIQAQKMPTMKQMPLNAKNAHLRVFTQQGDNHIVDVKKSIGKKINENDVVSVFDPEIRDISGEWLKAQFRGTLGFIRVNKLTGTKSESDWKKAEKGEIAAPTGAAIAEQEMGPYFEKEFRANGNGFPFYLRLVKRYAGFESVIAGAYEKLYGLDQLRLMYSPERMLQYPTLHSDVTQVFKKLFGEDRLNSMLLTRQTTTTDDLAWLDLFGILYSGDHPGMILAIMDHIKNNPGKGDELETAYNQHIPAQGYDVPATLGEIVNTHFVNVFQTQGNSFGVYNQLLADYPDFGYRLKPAYRKLFGQDQLDTMLQQRQTADFATDVPDPNSFGNWLERIEFELHAPFVQANFEPNVGNKGQKFDVSFDPSTNVLKLTVRVAFEFSEGQDFAVSKEVDPTSRFARKTWTEGDKYTYKHRYIEATAGVFNSSGIKIACLKPGWEHIVVTPKFVIEPVEPGNGEHFVSKAQKAFVKDDPSGPKIAKGMSGASAGSQLLSEVDVYDKLNDPSVHMYLHKQETEQNIVPAYELDRQRLDKTLQRFGTITVPSAIPMRDLIDNLKRLSIPSDLAHLHPINIEIDNSDAKRGLQIHKHIRTRLHNAGIMNPIHLKYMNSGTPSVKLTIAPENPSIKETYVKRWSRLTAAHEFGHMIGLIDEYYEASSSETVKEMISAGLLPPNTRSDHLKLHPPKSNMAKQQSSKQATQMDALRRAGIETPDLAMDAPGGKDPKSTSLMSGGYRVERQHFLSAWEALAHVTKDYVHEKFWKIT